MGISPVVVYAYDPPIIETLDAEEITVTGARLKGRVTYDGGAALGSVGFWWRDITANGTWKTMFMPGEYHFGDEFDLYVSFNAGTDVEYMAFGSNQYGIDNGETKYFTTTSWPDIGDVEALTVAADNITATEAIIRGNVVEDGGIQCYGTFLFWRPGSGWEQVTSDEVVVFKGQNFEAKLNDLSANTTYYFATIVTQIIEPYHSDHGETLSFTTDEEALALKIETLEVTDITDNSSKLHVKVVEDGGKDVELRVYYQTFSYYWGMGERIRYDFPGTYNKNDEVTANITGLRSDTLYRVQGWGKNNTEIDYGEYEFFTTTGTQTSSTIATDDVGVSYARLSGTITTPTANLTLMMEYRLTINEGFSAVDIPGDYDNGDNWTCVLGNLEPETDYIVRLFMLQPDDRYYHSAVVYLRTEAEPEAEPTVPEILDETVKQIDDSIEDTMEILGLLNNTGKWIVMIVFMVVAYYIFRKNKFLSVVGPIVVLGIGMALGWIQVWFLVLIALGAGLTVYQLLSKKITPNRG